MSSVQVGPSAVQTYNVGKSWNINEWACKFSVGCSWKELNMKLAWFNSWKKRNKKHFAFLCDAPYSRKWRHTPTVCVLCFAVLLFSSFLFTGWTGWLFMLVDLNHSHPFRHPVAKKTKGWALDPLAWGPSSKRTLNLLRVPVWILSRYSVLWYIHSCVSQLVGRKAGLIGSSLHRLFPFFRRKMLLFFKYIRFVVKMLAIYFTGNTIQFNFKVTLSL